MLKRLFLPAIAVCTPLTWAQDDGLSEADIKALNNRAPIVYGEIVKMDAASDVVINVLANDRDPDEDELTIIDAEAQEGTVEIQEGKRLYYIAPPMSEGGKDSVVYTVHDGNGPRDSVEAIALSKTVHFDLMVEFDEMSVAVPALYMGELSRLAAMMKVTPDTKVRVESFLPTSGRTELKEKLALWRGRAVAGVLIKQYGIAKSQIDIVPSVPISGAEGVDRRVQVSFRASVRPLVSSARADIDIIVRPRYLPPPPPPLALEEITTEPVVAVDPSVVDEHVPAVKKEQPLSRREQMKWYVWLDVGSASGKADTSALEADLLSEGATEVSTQTEEDRFGGQLGLGYRFAPYWAVELGLVDLGDASVSATRKTPGPAASISTAHTYHPPSASGVSVGTRFMFPLSRSLSFIANAGVWAWQSEYSLSSSYGRSLDGQSDGVDVLYGFGVSKAYFQELDLRVMWQNFVMDNADVDFLSVGFTFRFQGL